MKQSIKGLSFLIFFFNFFSEISIADDTITRNQSITDNQTLVSSNETFELGFFSPDNSNNRYLGIWYKNPPTKTVVWVANRDNPLTNSSGILRISDDGSLILLNQTNSVIWSTSSSGASVDPIAQLLESGNLILRDRSNGYSESYIWQSFDFPSDTLLPGMKLGWNLKTGLNRYLTSWKNNDDPSNGVFSCHIENPLLPQLVIRRGLMKQNRFGPWNGVRFSGGPDLTPSPIFIHNFTYNTDEVYYMNERGSNSLVIRTALNYSGVLEFRFWKFQSNDWSVMFTLQQQHCDTYNLCGANGVCDINNSPICKCLKGFTPKSLQEWAELNYSSGCIRRTQLDCGMDKFEKFLGVQLPDTLTYWLDKSLSLTKCEEECSKNCSCMAYANSDIREGGSGCILWFKDLIDMRQVSNNEQDLFIRMAASEIDSNTRTNKKKRRIILSVVSVLLLFGLIICCIILKKKQNRTADNIIHNQERDRRDGSREEDLELPLFDWVTIASATNNFSFSNKIGEGGFGPVYKGVLATGLEIAVKRLSKNSGQGIEQFKNEVILIAKLQHRNLVRLLGCCIQGEERLLIYEYLPNKSLDNFIFDETRSIILDWQQRFDIIVGIARGILYLHRDSRLRIVHRDLKASNILLDSQMNPKISDFGMARIFGGDQSEAKTKRVVGTYGYMSPEYAIDGLFSVKSDVFSFGVLVLEIISSRRNRGFYHHDHDLNLLGHAWKLWNEGKELELIDVLMKDSFPVSQVVRCIQVGLLCLQKRTEDRPTMSSVILMLDSESETLPQPNQPGFYTGRSLVENEASSSRDGTCSENGITITLIGR